MSIDKKPDAGTRTPTDRRRRGPFNSSRLPTRSLYHGSVSTQDNQSTLFINARAPSQDGLASPFLLPRRHRQRRLGHRRPILRLHRRPDRCVHPTLPVPCPFPYPLRLPPTSHPSLKKATDRQRRWTGDHGATVHAVDGNGWTVLHAASRRGHPGVV